MNKSETAKIVTYLMAQHDVTISPELHAVWHDQFQLIDYETAQRAARLLISKKTYGTPKCSDFHEALAQLEQSNCTDEEAWEKLLQVVGTCGRYQQDRAMIQLAQIDPLIAEAAKSVYAEILNSDANQLAAVRAHFWRILNAKRTRIATQKTGVMPLTAPTPKTPLTEPNQPKLDSPKQ